MLGKREVVVEPTWLCERDVSRMLGISMGKLRIDRCKRRGLPYVKFGKSVRYALTDIQTYMDSRKIILV